MALKLGFVGLGVMGFPMAGHLAQAGHAVVVYNRTRAKAQAWCDKYPGGLARSPADAATNADFILMCVGNDHDVREVVLGDDGVLHGMQAGAILVDHTTASADLARELHNSCASQGCGFIDAPVSGGQAGAESGALSIMAGGDPEVFKRVVPLLSVYSRMLRHMGPAGCGQLTKMVNQICIGGLLQGLSEALHFAEHAGLDVESVVEVISKGAAQSWQMENRYQTMLRREFDFGFAVDWMRKDFSIVLEEARRNGSQLPVTELVDQFYADVQAMGGGRWDTSSLIARLDQVGNPPTASFSGLK